MDIVDREERRDGMQQVLMRIPWRVLRNVSLWQRIRLIVEDKISRLLGCYARSFPDSDKSWMLRQPSVARNQSLCSLRIAMRNSRLRCTCGPSPFAVISRFLSQLCHRRSRTRPNWAARARLVLRENPHGYARFGIGRYRIARCPQNPATYLEAAQIDGASKWRQFWNITLPLLSPTTFFVTIISIIASFQVFDMIYVMTGGGQALQARRWSSISTSWPSSTSRLESVPPQRLSSSPSSWWRHCSSSGDSVAGCTTTRNRLGLIRNRVN
jgi:hypothetical protein